MGEVEWARIAVGPTLEGKARPPLIVWRFKERNKPLEEQFALAVNSFHGRIDWLLDRTSRNWVLMPREVSVALREGGWRTDTELILHIAATRPDFSQDSMEDLEEMIGHLEHAME
ncbi:hypothetical protein [Nonomuraea cavernae]|uniref:hypothetical protein n=1 Tax=Nonomuraea cavernae TaxID=2045107 RepID=UPI00166F31B4|nr:hypothetical protein [Nonomuraea cavernae]MCA2190604.1 hypothetical protein [Nonomuraea cavernae]